MGFIGKKPTAAPLTSSDVADGIITNAKLAQDIISGDTALAATPADTDEFLVSDAGVLKRMDYSHIKGGGKILQVVEGDLTNEFNTNNTSAHQASGLTVDITPSATSSKVFVLASFNGRTNTSGEPALYTIYRDSTNLAGGDVHFVSMSGVAGSEGVTMQCLDSPSSTSALTYQVYCYHSAGGGAYAIVNNDGIAAKITVFEIGA